MVSEIIASMTGALEFVTSTSPIVNFSRAVVAAVWVVALVEIWKCRKAPMANQAFTAAVALVLGEFLLIYSPTLPIEVLAFFLAMGQTAMAIAIMRMFRWVHEADSKGVSVRAAQLENPHSSSGNAIHTYVNTFVTVAITGLLYFSLVVLQHGHV